MQLFERIDGDYFTILGLPLMEALDFLRRHGCLAHGGAMSGERPFVLCLTGSLGMGKSTAAKFFAEAGVPVHDSDAVVHALYDGEAVPLVEQAFPGSTTDGKIDRTKLAAMVINDAAALRRLEAIVHPLVSASREKFLAEAQARGAAIVVFDIPLLVRNRRARAIAMLSSWSRRRPKSSASALSSGRA